MDTDGGCRRTLVGNLLDNIDGITINQKTNEEPIELGSR
jgi:hypothetical protein